MRLLQGSAPIAREGIGVATKPRIGENPVRLEQERKSQKQASIEVEREHAHPSVESTAILREARE
jgi:hypothetical protein